MSSLRTSRRQTLVLASRFHGDSGVKDEACSSGKQNVFFAFQKTGSCFGKQILMASLM
jgi:hypothetical protein